MADAEAFLSAIGARINVGRRQPSSLTSLGKLTSFLGASHADACRT